MYPVGIEMTNGNDHQPESDSYLRVFRKFLSQPKQITPRKGSFEYMEMAEKPLENEILKFPEHIPELISKVGTHEEEDNCNEQYLECIDTSNCDAYCQNQEKFLSFCLKQDLDLQDPTSKDFISDVDQNTAFDDEILLLEDDILLSSDFSSNLFNSLNQAQQMTGCTNYDKLMYQPSLSCIEEGDEASGLPYSKNIVDNESYTDSDTEEGSGMFSRALSKVGTFDDLRQIGSESPSDEETDCSEIKQVELDDFTDKEMEVASKKQPDSGQNCNFLAATSQDQLPSKFMSATSRGASSSLGSLDWSDDPPVLAVESLEDYLREMKEQRFRSHNSPHASNVTCSSSLSRDKTDQMHHSTPDIAGLSIYEDVDNHYLPVSYAGVKVKRKNWIKRSVSNASDRYYFSGENNPKKMRTLKKQIVRKLSKKYKSCDSVDGALEQVSKSSESVEINKKFSRKSNIRSMVGRFIRQMRRHDNNPKKKMRESTWSLPTNLDSSCSSSYGDYSITDSESTVER